MRIRERSLAFGDEAVRSRVATVAANLFLAGGGDNFTVFAEQAAFTVAMVDLDTMVATDTAAACGHGSTMCQGQELPS